MSANHSGNTSSGYQFHLLRFAIARRLLSDQIGKTCALCLPQALEQIVFYGSPAIDQAKDANECPFAKESDQSFPR